MDISSIVPICCIFLDISIPYIVASTASFAFRFGGYGLQLTHTKRGGDGVGRVLSAVQHRCNPLHVYCRLIEKGISREVSIRLSRAYEASIYWWLIFFLTVVSFLVNRLARKGWSEGFRLRKG